MRKHRFWIMPLFVALGFFFGISSFLVQYRVSGLDGRIRVLEEKIREADDGLRVLRAELSHLTTLARIRRLSGRYLPDYRNISSYDFIRVVDIPADPRLER